MRISSKRARDLYEVLEEELERIRGKADDAPRGSTASLLLISVNTNLSEHRLESAGGGCLSYENFVH